LELDEAKIILKFVLEKLESLDASLSSKEEALDLINKATKSCSVKKGLVMKSLRAALFGTLNGPDLVQSWVLLSRFSKDRTRISRFI
jgi:glutamyl-tRNA synthetase